MSRVTSPHVLTFLMTRVRLIADRIIPPHIILGTSLSRSRFRQKDFYIVARTNNKTLFWSCQVDNLSLIKMNKMKPFSLDIYIIDKTSIDA